MTYLEQLEQMLDTGFHLVSIETYDPDRVEELFTQLSRFSSKPIYLSQGNEGLYRIGASHIKIPRTQLPHELLKHILGSRHTSVFILRGFNKDLQQEANIKLMKQIANTEDCKAIVVLLDEFIDLPDSLKPFTLRSKHQMRKAM